MRYILTKNNIKRLIDGKYIVDGHGRRFYAGDNIKEILRSLDERNLYDEIDAIVENGQFDLVRKQV